jgi:hypothetical protein
MVSQPDDSRSCHREALRIQFKADLYILAKCFEELKQLQDLLQTCTEYFLLSSSDRSSNRHMGRILCMYFEYSQLYWGEVTQAIDRLQEASGQITN